MLDITEPKLYQNFFSIEIQLTLLVVIVLCCALGIFKIINMDLLRASQNKRFYQTYDEDLRPTIRLLQATTIGTDGLPTSILDTPPLSSQSSTASQRTSTSESAVSVSVGRATSLSQLPPSIVDDFINNSPHRTCEMCRQYEKTLKTARASLNEHNYETKWNATEAKITLREYEEFIEKMMKDYDQLRTENEVGQLHIRNLTTAFENLQSKFQRAKLTIGGLKRNEESYLSQLSKYETMFLLISEANQSYQARELQKQIEERKSQQVTSKKTIKPRKFAKNLDKRQIAQTDTSLD